MRKIWFLERRSPPLQAGMGGREERTKEARKSLIHEGKGLNHQPPTCGATQWRGVHSSIDSTQRGRILMWRPGYRALWKSWRTMSPVPSLLERFRNFKHSFINNISKVLTYHRKPGIDIHCRPHAWLFLTCEALTRDLRIYHPGLFLLQLEHCTRFENLTACRLETQGLDTTACGLGDSNYRELAPTKAMK